LLPCIVGFGTRALYTDDEEALFDAMRPQVANGINRVVLRGDLQERSIEVTLLPIPKDERRPEREFWTEFETARPKTFGALLDAVSGALRNLEDVRLEELPRMADFAVWVTAAEEALGWEPGEFMAAYSSNQREATESALEADPVAVALRKVVERLIEHELRGTSEDLLERLGEEVSDDVKRSKAWPKAANALSRRLNCLAPLLREAGIEYSEDEVGREKKKVKILRKFDDGGSEEGSQGSTTADERPASDEGDASRPSSGALDKDDGGFDFGDFGG
jgi:putative DNA primase/helicase